MVVDIPPGLEARGPAEATPRRRPGSVRRTSTIDMDWPAGVGTQLRLSGHARDLLSPSGGGEPTVLGEDTMTAGIHPLTRAIEYVESSPTRAALSELIGARAGGNSRRVLANAVADEEVTGTPLYLMLDDIAGSSLIARFAYAQWMERDRFLNTVNSGRRRNMEGVCTGFQPGSGALMPDGTSTGRYQIQQVTPLPRNDDPLGWHMIPTVIGMGMRRARRIDVFGTDLIEIDSMFQDSSTTPSGDRVAVHEYRLTATADRGTQKLLSIEADPRVLPYDECPLASVTVSKILGTPLSELRTVVLERFPRTAGCTHLNDAMRALADVPMLFGALVESQKL